MSALISSPEPRAGLPLWIGKLALLLAIAAFELHVVSLIPRPHHSEQYRRRYLAATSECFFTDDFRRTFLAERRQPAEIEMQDTDPRLSCMYMPDGWRKPRDGKATSLGTRSLLTLPVPPAGDRILLDLTAPSDLRYPLVIAIRQGNRLLYQGQIAPGQRDTVAIAPDTAASRDGMVLLTMDRSFAAGSKHVGRKKRQRMRVELTRIRYARA